MFCDMHCHTSGISLCARISAEKNIKKAKELGYDALSVNNHYVSYYFSEDDYEDWIEKYINEWEECKRYGEIYGVRIFCGIEVTMDFDKRVHLLIYGCDADFLRKNPLLCQKSLEELYNICKENGCALVQAHPFRGGSEILDTRFLDGMEINCHPSYLDSHYEEILGSARENEKAVTVGCDYHKDTRRPMGGMFLPDTIKTDRDLADYIKNSKEFYFQIDDPKNGRIFKLEYER